jgi:hypothetical protein
MELDAPPSTDPIAGISKASDPRSTARGVSDGIERLLSVVSLCGSRCLGSTHEPNRRGLGSPTVRARRLNREVRNEPVRVGAFRASAGRVVAGVSSSCPTSNDIESPRLRTRVRAHPIRGCQHCSKSADKPRISADLRIFGCVESGYKIGPIIGLRERSHEKSGYKRRRGFTCSYRRTWNSGESERISLNSSCQPSIDFSARRR